MLKKTSLYFFVILLSFVTLYGCGDSKDDKLQAAIDKNKELEAELLKKAQEGKAKPPAVSVCGRTKGMQAIILYKVKKTDCKAVTDQDLLSIKTITRDYFEVGGVVDLSSLKANDFPGMKANDFSGLTLLSVLMLPIDRSVDSVPVGMLSGLASLEILVMHGSSNIKVVPPDLLSGSPSLEIVEFDSFLLDDVPVNLFSGLTKVRKIRIYSQNYPKGLFSNFPSLEELDLALRNISEEAKQRIQAEVGESVRVY